MTNMDFKKLHNSYEENITEKKRAQLLELRKSLLKNLEIGRISWIKAWMKASKMCGIETDALSSPLNATQRSFVKKLQRENNFAFQQLDCGWRHHSAHAMDMPKYTPIICGDANQNTYINC